MNLNELESYDGLLGQDIYANTPDDTIKMLLEIEGGGHGSSYSESSRYKSLYWASYFLMEDQNACELLLERPNDASQFLTTLTCSQDLPGDINGDTAVNVQDVILTVNFILQNQYDSSADLNDDGGVNVQDVILIMNIILAG